MPDNEIKHFLRYGTHAESKYFLMDEFRNGYDAVIFNGNMVAYTASAIAGFIVNLKGKPFIIDPQTHAFQHDIYKLGQEDDTGTLIPKKSIQKLADNFGAPIKDIVGKESLLPENISDENTKKELCKKVINFQLDIRNRIEQKPEWKYLKFALDNGRLNADIFSPMAVVPPYFYMTANTIDDWLQLNIDFIKIAKEEFADKKIYSQLVISKDVLVSLQLKTIIQKYKESLADGVLIWVDGLDEASTGKEFLQGFIDLLNGLSPTKIIINLYGGYFSILLLQKQKLNGVCHGLEYGENRGVVPVGGGIPMAKYYFFPLHKRIRFTDFVKILRQKGWMSVSNFKANVCNLECCEDGNVAKYGMTKPIKYKRGDQVITLNYPTPETKEYSLKHYLLSKQKEFLDITTKQQDELLADLETAFNDYKQIFGLDEIVYLSVWKTLIENVAATN